MTDSKAPTHTAYALKREGKRYGKWLEIGNARQDSAGVIHVYLDRTPIGGFNGYAYLAPIGAQPPLPEPERPGQDSEAEDACL
jgi:hypothetical protein